MQDQVRNFFRFASSGLNRYARRWLENRQADLLPVDYYHVVFTLPAPIRDIAYQNKAGIYHLLFKATAETLLTIAADSKRLGAHQNLADSQDFAH